MRWGLIDYMKCGKLIPGRDNNRNKKSYQKLIEQLLSDPLQRLAETRDLPEASGQAF